MINLEEEARKRRERLKSSLSSVSEPKESSETETRPSKEVFDVLPNENRKRRDQDDDEGEFSVPEGEIILDSTGAEILGMDLM